VALGIIGNPELIFLDEPTTGSDPEARVTTHYWQLIRKLRDEGATILFSYSLFSMRLKALADRVAVINKGKIVEVSTPALLGGRATSLATVSWRDGVELREEESANPTALVAQSSAQFGGEVPELDAETSFHLKISISEMIGGRS
jgi:ABC-2 type transport system ATP-binding protein